MSITSILRECATDLLETEDKVGVEQVVTCAYRRHADQFAQASEAMVLDAARRIVRGLLRDLSSDDNEQLSFPSMAGLPSAIAVQTPDGTYYVRQDKATWSELQAGRDVRAENVTRAQAKLDAYDDVLDALRPYMEGTDRSVADAVALMSNEAA